MASTAKASTPVDGVPSFLPGSDEYAEATAPLNAHAQQHPALVAVPADIEQVAACVRHAVDNGLVVVPQATGHGAAATLGREVLLLDTSELDHVEIDAEHRMARVGAGCQWRAVNAEAIQHGLLGRAGSAPNVGVAGFTFGAGAGWLTRPWGLAPGSLTAVEYVDGRGAVHRAADDAERQIDRDVIWACRGGGGVGIAASLEFGLVPVDELWAGLRIWPIDALDAVVAAWAHGMARVGPSLATSLAVLAAPPIPAIPEPLHGQRVVHLSMATTSGADAAAEFEAAMSAAPAPSVDTWGPSDLDRLEQVHLDPPGAVPAVGSARWLDDSMPAVALDVYHAALTGPIEMIEIRNVQNDAPVLDGALDHPPGNFMLHAVGGPRSDADLAALEEVLDRVMAAARPADTGLAVGSWSDGRSSVSDALPAHVRDRVAAIADAVDPDRVLPRPHVLGSASH